MEMRENMLFETLKHDLLSALILLDDNNNVVFINDTALNFLFEQGVEVKEFSDLILKAENNTISERKELKLKDKIIGFSLKKVFESNKLNRSVIVFKDITQIKQNEKETKRKEEMEVLGELALYIAHEIKNTLNIINGFSQLMLESNELEFIKNNLQILIEETGRLNKLTHNILDYTKGDNLFLEKTDIVAFLLQLLDKAYSKEKINFITTEKSLESTIDKDKLKQVFINIIQNGIEAIEEVEDDEGIFNIYVEVEKSIDIIFETNKKVEENFPLDNIFNPYFTTKKNGNGLGLALCKKIIEEHGGLISVQKNFYEGLTFIISLPKENL